MSKFMSDEHEDDGSKTMPASQLPPEWQTVLMNGTTRFSSAGLRTDVVFPYGEVLWNFVLPDGTPLEWEESLGHLSSLIRDPGPPPDYTSKSVLKPIPLRAGSSSALMFKTDDSSVASKLPELAAAHGFAEVWLQTWRSDCLRGAIRAAKTLHLRVRFVIKPWEIPAGTKTADADRTILDDTSTQAEDRLESSAVWQQGSPIWGEPPITIGRFMASDSQARSAVWRNLFDLSKTDGLDGVVVCDTEPHGYEPLHTRYSFGRRTELLELGYSQSQRGRFLEENRVDPVDIVDKRLMPHETLDLGLPFFGDPKYVSLDDPPGSLVKWQQLRSDANRQAIVEFVSQLSGPILFQPRHTHQGTITLDGVQVIPWTTGSEVPSADYQLLEEEADKAPADGYCLWQFGHPDSPLLTSRIFDNLNRHLKSAKGMLAIDLSSLPAREMMGELDKWFVSGASGH